MTATGSAVLWIGLLVHMGDEREGARIGASPYDPVPRRGDLVKKVCRNVVYYNDSMIGCYN